MFCIVQCWANRKLLHERVRTKLPIIMVRIYCIYFITRFSTIDAINMPRIIACRPAYMSLVNFRFHEM